MSGRGRCARALDRAGARYARKRSPARAHFLHAEPLPVAFGTARS